MSLASNLTSAFTRVGTEFKAFRSFLTGSGTGAFSGLTTTATNLKDAINELDAAVDAAAASGGATNLDQLTDVVISGAATGEILRHNGTNWVDVMGTTHFEVAGAASTAQTAAATDATNKANAAQAAAIAASTPASHATNTSNPHAVTKAQVGLGSVDNTADTAKPVSTAQQTALNLKANTASLATVATSGSAADLTGTLPTSALPPLAVNEVYVVASQAAMLALTAQRGDVAIRTDDANTYILATDSPGTLADWKQVTATGDVSSVAGRTGIVVLTKTDVGLANVDNTSDANKPVSTAEQTALNLKANLASPTFTGTVGGITAAMVGLGSVNNTADSAKPVSTAQQTALNLKMDKSANLSDVASVATARTNLSVYSQTEIGDPTTDFTAAFVAALA